tara:strand:+ start:79989 stop:80696 length:708 start_codon:yes stop_codon:yes gene_type:complete
MKRVAFLVLFFTGFSTISYSKSSYSSIWLDYNHSNKLSEKWSFQSDYGYRFRPNYTYNWQRLHARTALVYSFPKVKWLAGAAVFAVFEPQSFLDFEIRPWQGLKFGWKPTPKWKVSNFVRIEERFHFLGTDDGSAFNYFLFILRYSLTVKYAFNSPKDNHGKWVGFVGFEPFILLNDNQQYVSITKSRTTIGMQYHWSKKTQVKLGYIYQPKNIPIVQNTVFYSHIIRLSVVQKF